MFSMSGSFTPDAMKPLIEKYGRWFTISCYESLPSANFTDLATCLMCGAEYAKDSHAERGWRPVDLPLDSFFTSKDAVTAEGLRYFDIHFTVIDGWPHRYVNIGLELMEEWIISHLKNEHRGELAKQWVTIGLEEHEAMPAVIYDEMVMARAAYDL